jgi:hypothetical protein
MYYSGKIFTYRLDRTTVTAGAPRMLAMSTSPASAGASSWASAAAGSSAITAAGSVLPSATGGWRVSCATSSSTVGAGATSSRLSHRIPIAFVPLLYGAGRWNLLQAMEFHRQHTTSRNKYSTTLLKEAYLLGCGLCDLKLLGHALAVHVARLPWRRRQTSLQASWRILNERDML